MLKTPPSTQPEAQVAILGGGIVGLWAAWLASKAGYSVLLYCLDNSSAPSADTLRNHSWLQSGVLYAGKLDPRIVLKFWSSGREQFNQLGLAYPTGRGIFSFAPGQEVADFTNNVATLGLDAMVEEVQNSDARQLLGDFYQSNHRHFLVPDTYFDESAILETLRKRARLLGAELLELPGGTTARLVRTRSTRAAIEIDGQRVRARSILVTAGYGTRRLLADLGLTIGLRVFKSPILRVDAVMNCPLYVNRTNDLAVVRHYDKTQPDTSCLVVSDRTRMPVTDPEQPTARLVASDEYEPIRKKLPPAIQSSPFRVYGGFKTEETVDGDGTTVAPVIRQFQRFPGLFAAVPGKATLGFWTAGQLLQLAGLDMNRRPSSTRRRINSAPKRTRPGNTWGSAIRMVYDKHYDPLDERKP